MIDKNDPWNSILNLAHEIKKCDELELITPSLAMCFIAIDSLASISRPLDKNKASRKDFILWVDRYLSCHPEQKYKYTGRDVYAARCSFLHTYGATSELHKKDPTIVKFLYHDGGRHSYNPDAEPTLVIIGARSFTNDVICAIQSFIIECGNDINLRERAEARLDEVFNIVPIK